MSIELGLLPPETIIVSGKNKKPKDNHSQPSPQAMQQEPTTSHLPALLEAAAVANAQPPFAPLQTTTSGTSASLGVTDSSKPQQQMKKPERKKPGPKPKKLSATTPAAIASSSSLVTSNNKRSTPEPMSEDDDDEEEEDEKKIPLEPMNPETALYPDKHVLAPPHTVHWDPHDRDGTKVGWKIRIQCKPDTAAGTAASKHEWLQGRVTRYDPYYHKHKIEFENSALASVVTSNNKNKKQKQATTSAWIWIRSEEHNIRLATKIVWAHVKGYAWWPAVVIESNDEDDQRPGSVHVEFFGSDEVAWLKNTAETIRPFSLNEIDPIVAKHKKKRNSKAFELACEEYDRIRTVRNDAAVFYAQRAIEFARRAGKQPLVAKRIQLHRHDINYPYGETLNATVRAYSPTQKKWLVSFDITEKSRVKYDACWMNLVGKDVGSLQILSKSSDTTVEDLVPFVYAYEMPPADQSDARPSGNTELASLLQQTCRGCVEYWKKGDTRVNCDECDGEWHLSCFDPPLTLEAWQRMVKDAKPIICPRCTPCRGCYQKDIVFGCLPQPKPPTLSFPRDETLDLCYACILAYGNTEYCSNCAHTYNSDKLDKVATQMEALSRRRKLEGVICDSQVPLALSSFVGDDSLPLGAKVDPSFYHPETSEWGYGEKDMLVCDKCDIWIHAGCAGIGEMEYDDISDGKHPVFSKEFLCRVCCRQRCRELIDALHEKDVHLLFTSPVTEKEAPNYYDVIKFPMDLGRMREKADAEEYLHYAWVREDFELMVLNALVFNLYYTQAWREAERYYTDCLKTVFNALGKAAPPSTYASAIDGEFRKAKEAKKNEESRVQIDDSVEKKDLVAGTATVTMALPELRAEPPDQPACIPFTEVKMWATDAFYSSWMDCCYTCGSSGAMDCLIFCCECGESFHTFCVNAPIHSMDAHCVNAWRCPSCKVCEISGQVPEEETHMIFCEMCDRAFTLDLLDPPLKAAPPGLWICGQCVDCKICRNTAEPGGARLTHWSKDPERCFRCGGCDGLECDRIRRCVDCLKFVRETDDDVIQCSSCHGCVHTGCLGSLKEGAVRPSSNMVGSIHSSLTVITSLLQQENKISVCRSCRPHETASDITDTVADWSALSHMADILVDSLNGYTSEELSKSELRSMILGTVAWTSREMWREQYEEIIREGLRALAAAAITYDDPRILLQHAIGQGDLVPTWTLQRAYRFVLVARRSRWTVDEPLDSSIESLVQGAKLASSFLFLAHSMTISVDKKILFSKRVATLGEAPDSCGMITLPLDPVWHGTDMEPLLFNPGSATGSSGGEATDAQSVVVSTVAMPLCGWSDDRSAYSVCIWRDPRCCVLCGLPGDDDAGLEHEDGSNTGDAKLGRLLPFNDGSFVHSGKR